MTKAEARHLVAAIAAVEVRNSLLENEALSARVGGADLDRCREAAQDLIDELTRRSGQPENYGVFDLSDFSQKIAPGETSPPPHAQSFYAKNP